MNLVLQVIEASELKDLKHHFNKARERKERRTTKLHEFQDIGMELELKEVDALHIV